MQIINSASSPFRCEWIRYNGKRYYTVTKNGRPIVQVTTALINLQNRRKEAKQFAQYAMHFLTFLFTNYRIDCIADATSRQLTEFCDYLQSTGSKDGTIKNYAVLADKLFDEYKLDGYQLDKSLEWGDRHTALDGLKSLRRNKLTIAGYLFRCKTGMRYEDRLEKLRTKHSAWRTKDEIDRISQELSLRNRCIYQIGMATGYRISSIISIPYNIDDLKRSVVNETFSKTGKLHEATIPKKLNEMLIRYVTEERSSVVASAGFDCGALFIISSGRNKGQPLTADTFYTRLKYAQNTLRAKYPEYKDIVLHSHDGRVTYFNNLMEKNREDKLAGKSFLTDLQICQCMDWMSMQSLENYYKYEEQCNTKSLLLSEFEREE